MKQRALAIGEKAKRTAEAIVRIGQWLVEVKERLEHGQWLPWLKGEFGWSDFTAKSFTRVYRQFKSEKFSDLQIDASARRTIQGYETIHKIRQVRWLGKRNVRAENEFIDHIFGLMA